MKDDQRERGRQRVLVFDQRTLRLSALERRRMIEALAELLRLTVLAPREQEVRDAED